MKRLTQRSAVLAVTLVVFLSMLCLAGSAAPDKVADFKDAAGSDNCDAIPYQNERTTCKNRSDDKNRACKDFSCDKAAVTKDLEEYKEKLKNLQDARSRNNEQAARSLEETLKVLEAKLNGHKRLAKELIESGYNCLAARETVQRSFSDAKQMVTAETDQALQQYVPDLVRKYEIGRQEHILPMQQTTRAIDNCKWVSEISW